MIDILFDASIADVLESYVSDPRLQNALYGQGIIGAYAGPRDWGTASVKLMHYQGDLLGQGPVWGYVEGGMGRISFAIAEAARDLGAVLAAGVPVAEILPGEGVRLEGGDLIRAKVVVSNADPKRALGMLEPDAVPDAFRARLEAWQIRSPVVKFNAALDRLPDVHRRAGEVVAVPVDDHGHPWHGGRPGRVRSLSGGRAGGRLRRGLLPDRLRPVACARGQAPHQRVRPVRALRAGRGHLGQPSGRGAAAVRRPDRGLRARLRRLHRPRRGARSARHRGPGRAHRRPHLPGRDDARPDVGAPPHAPHARSTASTSAAPPPTRPARSSVSTAATPPTRCSPTPPSSSGRSCRPAEVVRRQRGLDGGDELLR